MEAANHLRNYIVEFYLILDLAQIYRHIFDLIYLR